MWLYPPHEVQCYLNEYKMHDNENMAILKETITLFHNIKKIFRGDYYQIGAILYTFKEINLKKCNKKFRKEI